MSHYQRERVGRYQVVMLKDTRQIRYKREVTVERMWIQWMMLTNPKRNKSSWNLRLVKTHISQLFYPH